MTAVRASRPRVAALDLTKGALVVCMVIYHSLNYSTQRHLGFLLLAFLPPSFILITGFLISHIYLARHSGEGWHLHARLLTRGAKLLVLFTLLNVLAQMLVQERARGQMPGMAVFWSHWFDTYVSGDGRLAILEVLLPIAYLLLLAPLLLCLDRWHLMVLPTLIVAVLTVFAYLEGTGKLWANAQLLSAGMVGMLLGRLSIEKLDLLARHRVAAVLAYTAFVGFEAAAGQRFGFNYLLQLLGAGLALATIYSICAKNSVDSPLLKRLELLGRYSLFAYIAQIVILNILTHLIGRPAPLSIEFLMLLCGGLVFTQAAVEFLNWTRVRSKWSDSVYTAVFA